MHKDQEGTNVKTHYVFTNDPTKIMCFEHKTRMKVDHKIKILKLCITELFTNKFVIFYEAFYHEFCLGIHAFSFLSLWLSLA
jgi:hypothetical protein